MFRIIVAEKVQIFGGLIFHKKIGSVMKTDNIIFIEICVVIYLQKSDQ